MKLVGGIIPFLGWRKYSLDKEGMAHYADYFCQCFPDEKDHEYVKEVMEAIDYADILILSTFELEWLDKLFFQFIREKVLIKFEDEETKG